MLGAGNIGKRWTFSTRFIDSEEKEERWIHIVEYRFNQNFSYGIEYNPGDNSANLFRIIWTLSHETEKRPMITVSTSETRAGSVSGGHANLSFAKSLPKSPFGAYVAIHYSVDRGIEFPYGFSVQLNKEFSFLPMWDTEKWNFLLNYVKKDYWITAGLHGDEPLLGIGWGFGEVKR